MVVLQTLPERTNRSLRGHQGDSLTYDFVMVVWGSSYTDLWLNVALASHLSAGNLPGMGDLTGSRYVVYTTPEDAKIARAHPLMHKLQELLPVEFLGLGSLGSAAAKYSRMNYCHAHAVEQANARGAALVFLSPDNFLGDGSLAHAAGLLAQGKRVVLTATLRVVRQTFEPAIKAKLDLTAHPSAMPFTRSQLVQLAMEHVHPQVRSLCWDSPDHCWTPSTLYFPAGDQGLLARCFHLHPLMIQPENLKVMPQTSIDADFPAQACPRPESRQIIEDSEQVLMIEISPGDDPSLMKHVEPDGATIFNHWQNHPQVPSGFLKSLSIAYWAQVNARPDHFQYVQHKYRFRAGHDLAKWEAVERRSDQIIQHILEWSRHDLARTLFSLTRAMEQHRTPQLSDDPEKLNS